MSWTTALADLRIKLSDGDKDKLRYRKKLLGDLNGTNVIFKTLEFRRTTDFTAPVGPEGVYVNGALVSVASDSAETGEVVLSAAPANGDTVEATYYVQWFTDVEIQTFLRLAMNFMALGDDYTTLESGLRPSALSFAAGEAYEKLSLRWSERLSEVYLLQDQIPKEQYGMIDTYKKWAQVNMDKASTLRKDFYSRAGTNEIPAFGQIFGGVRDPVPKR